MVKRQDYIRLGIILLMVAAITAMHYLTSTTMHQYHDIYRRLYYIPIILGGLWFTIRGGLAVAVLVSVVYAPHVLLQWGHLPATDWNSILKFFSTMLSAC